MNSHQITLRIGNEKKSISHPLTQIQTFMRIFIKFVLQNVTFYKAFVIFLCVFGKTFGYWVIYLKVILSLRQEAICIGLKII